MPVAPTAVNRKPPTTAPMIATLWACRGNERSISAFAPPVSCRRYDGLTTDEPRKRTRYATRLRQSPGPVFVTRWYRKTISLTALMSVMHVTNATGFPGGTRTDQLVVWDQRGPSFPASVPRAREARLVRAARTSFPPDPITLIFRRVVR